MAVEWLHEVVGCSFELDYALAALDWAGKMPALADVLPSNVWWKLLEHLTQSAAEAGTAFLVGGRSQEDPLVWQLLAGELALTLAHCFPEISVCRKLYRESRRALSAGPVNLLDGKGVLHARHFDCYWPLLACWTRCRAMSNRMKHGCWSRNAEKQYRQAVRNGLRIARRDGSPAFGDPASNRSGVALLAAAVAQGGDSDDQRIAMHFLGRKNVDAARSVKRLNLGAVLTPSHDHKGKKSKAAMQSEWAAVAVLRPDWSRSSPRLTVLYPGDSCRVELALGKDVLWSGAWAIDLQVDGVKVAASSDWKQLCWVSDKDVDYLELELEFGEGLRVQRHFVMTREDGFLFMADAVLGSKPSAMEYRGTLPLRPGVAFREACETRRGALAAAKPLVTVLPLAMPERLATGVDGELSTTGDALQLRQATEAQALFAPMFFDYNRRRFRRPLMWRQLTVAESWTVQPADSAVGYRVAIGKEQWLIYRSLGRRGNRSVLGHNISTEMLVARFDRHGEVESLIEIE